MKAQHPTGENELGALTQCKLGQRLVSDRGLSFEHETAGVVTCESDKNKGGNAKSSSLWRSGSDWQRDGDFFIEVKLIKIKIKRGVSHDSI